MALTKRTTAATDALAVEVARLHFEDELPNTEIASRLGIDAREIAGCLRRARQSHLIALRVHEPSHPASDDRAERSLEEASGIRRVIAVKTPTTAAVEDSLLSPDRALHLRIAASAANFLWERIRDGDKIAVGAGRAVRFTVDHLVRIAQARPRSFHGVETISLTGNPVVRRDPNDLDSDAIASELGHALHADGAAIHRVNFGYVDKNPRRALRRVGSKLMEPTWARDQCPDLAIMGLGVLDTRHHLMARRDDALVAPVKVVLDRIEHEVLPVCSTAVMDIYDTFWVRDGVLDTQLDAIARELVSELNSKIVAVPWAKLDQTREKIIIAGGPYKYDGILAYLQQRDAIGLRSTVLVTDVTTANRLTSDLG